MSEIFKTFNKDDVSKRDFKAHKKYSLTLTGFSASYRPDQPIEFGNPKGNVVPSVYGYVGKADRFTEFNSGSEDINSIVAIPSRSIWDSLWHMYYRDWPEPGKVFCTKGDSREHRELYDTAYVISVPHYLYGEGIMPGSVEISCSSTPAGENVKLMDDKFGNLYNIAYATTSGATLSDEVPPKKGEVLYLPFKDLTPYQYMPAYGYGFLNEQVFSGSIRDYGMYETTIHSNRVKAVTGSYYGTGIEFTGMYGTSSTIPTDLDSAKYVDSWSYATIEQTNNKNSGGHLEFVESEDFAISCYIKITSSQLDTDHANNTIFSPVLTATSQSFQMSQMGSQSYFANLSIASNKVKARRRDGQGQTSVLTSTTSINDNKWHHILYQKSGSALELWIDYSKESTATHVDLGQITPHKQFGLGAQLANVEGPLDTYTNERPKELHINRALRGSIDEFRIYSGSLTAAQINYMSSSNGTGLNHWGNVFYEHGQIVLTHPSSAYITQAPEKGQVTFKGTTKITENLYSCNIKANEFNQTLNPSTIADTKTKELHTYTSTDVWNPFVTKIGLYNDEGQLLVIGSLAQPIFKMPEYDMTFVVRFDT